MKRFLLFVVVMMLTTMGLMAGHWTGPETGNYETKTSVIVTPQLNGAGMTSTQAVEIAAFIGDECRGVGSKIEANGKLLLEVNFDGDESDATVNFKAYYNGAEYILKEVAQLSGENQLTLTFNIQVPTKMELYGTHLNLEDDEYKSANLYDCLYFYFGSDDAIGFDDLGSYREVTFSTTDTEHITISGSTITAVKSTNARGVKVKAVSGTLSAEDYFVVAPIDYEIVAIRFGYEDTENDGVLEPQTRFDLDIESATNNKIDFADYIQYQIIDGYEMDPSTGEEQVYKEWVALRNEQDPEAFYRYSLNIPTTTITIPGYTITAQTVSGKLTYVLAPTVGTNEEGEQITLACTTSTNAQLSNTDAKIYVKPYVVLLQNIILTPETNAIPLMGTTNYKLTPVPTNASGFNIADYLLSSNHPNGIPADWLTAENVGYDNTDNTLGVKGYTIGSFTLTLYKKNGTEISEYQNYAGNAVTTNLKVGAIYEMPKGWDWVSYYYTNTDMATPAELRNLIELTEVRSQTEACYWDPDYNDGQFFGSLTSIEASAAYKVCSQVEETQEAAVYDGDFSVKSKALYKNYTWVGYPYQYDYASTDVLSCLGITFTNGDKVIGKNASLEYKNGSWTGSLTTFEAGHSYIFYVQTGKGQTIAWKSAAEMGQPAPEAVSPKAPAISVWNYDAHAFSNNMTIVAKVSGDKNYEIGAFVGDECRGEGKMVEFEGENYYFITVHGQTGEMVSFKAFDGMSYSDFDTTQSFTSIVGSLTEPMMLSGDFTNGINTISADGDEAQYLDLNGRAVNDAAHGIFVVHQNGVTCKVVK